MSITTESILDDLENYRLPLPTLPEVALRVRDTVDNEDSSITEVAQIIETDAALSARIIQVANSALYRGLNSADNVQNAVMRMGLNTVRNLTTSLVMKQLFQATHPVVDTYLRNAWKQSTDVAALSSMIAKTYTSLESDSALLAGLTHCIGISPILVKAEDDPDLINNQSSLDQLIEELYPVIGSEILKRWDFSDHLVRVPAEHLDIHRDGNNGKADYTDIVQVALIQATAGGQGPLSNVDQGGVSAIHRLGMVDSIEEIDMSGGIIEVEEIKEAIF